MFQYNILKEKISFAISIFEKKKLILEIWIKLCAFSMGTNCPIRNCPIRNTSSPTLTKAYKKSDNHYDSKLYRSKLEGWTFHHTKLQYISGNTFREFWSWKFFFKNLNSSGPIRNALHFMLLHQRSKVICRHLPSVYYSLGYLSWGREK